MQLEEQQQSTFNREAFQVPRPSSNISHGLVRSAVLNDKTHKVDVKSVGFDKAAWAPPE
tara:strand:- start:2436 stop:2612 length:177 start_codon:yes stop_codon:yes gene_type:complete